MCSSSEQAAGSLLDGRNPYAVVHDDGALATWPTWAQEHFPYLAAVLAVGMPRAIAGSSPWTDPRLVYLALAMPSILRSGLPAESRLQAFQLFVLVTAAPLVFTSGKEILVLGLLLASLIALHRGHAGVSIRNAWVADPESPPDATGCLAALSVSFATGSTGT